MTLGELRAALGPRVNTEVDWYIAHGLAEWFPFQADDAPITMDLVTDDEENVLVVGRNVVGEGAYRISLNREQSPKLFELLDTISEKEAEEEKALGSSESALD